MTDLKFQNADTLLKLIYSGLCFMLGNEIKHVITN